MDKVLAFVWAKTSRENAAGWHPLILHMLDIAVSADAILAREPESTRKRMAAILGMEWMEARPWLLLIIASHDLGKSCPGFQCKWLDMTGLRLPRAPNKEIHHAFVSQIVLAELLKAMSWNESLADLVADAVGCHHGERASENEKSKAEYEIYVGSGERLEAVRNDWTQARLGLVEALKEVFKPSKIPTKATLSGPDFMLLSGLTSFADWIGSNEDWFTFGTVEDCEDLPGWFQNRRDCAEQALDAIGWESRTPLAKEQKTFEQLFDRTPRPMQQAVADVLAGLQEPAILLIEAPMGEGKTEAAFYAHFELQRRFGHRGLYVALPTKATGNAMFKRTLQFIRKQGVDRKLDLQLLHGGTAFNDTFQNLRLSGIHDPETGGEIRAGEWFTNKKRALLSEYGVGTVDQAILPILPVRHNFVRLWGLANRVVVFDEIHAYDAYTGTLLVHLLRWLLSLGSSVVLLSATLPPNIRRELAKVVNAALPEQETQYPRLSVFRPGAVDQVYFEADPARRMTLRLQGIPCDLPSMQSALNEHLVNGGMGLALVNTVQRAQELYRHFPDGVPMESDGQRVGKRLADGTEIFLFHARFPADRRQKREDLVLATFGEDGNRSGRKILIATQVAEQSLDLDFDVIATDLAPIDLLLQRAGRLWRHKRENRPVAGPPTLIVSGLAGDEPPSFGKPLWWEKVYRVDILLRTWCLLREGHRQTVKLPDEIDTLVQAVYEDTVNTPDFLIDRMDKAILVEGEVISQRQRANMAIIGFPDDGSWKEVKFEMAGEDEPGLHPTLIAQTRLGEQSVTVIPLFPTDDYSSLTQPDFSQAKSWCMRAMSISRKGLVNKLKGLGLPEGWKKSTLLRNYFPLVLNDENCWIKDATVRLDDDLGLVYEPKEAE